MFKVRVSEVEGMLFNQGKMEVDCFLNEDDKVEGEIESDDEDVYVSSDDDIPIGYVDIPNGYIDEEVENIQENVINDYNDDPVPESTFSFDFNDVKDEGKRQNQLKLQKT